MKVPKIKYKFVIPVPFLELNLQFIELRRAKYHNNLYQKDTIYIHFIKKAMN